MSSEALAKSLLEARSLACIRGDRHLFSQLDLQAPAGTLLHIQGENGSGKSTLLRSLCGLYQPAEGTVLWNGEAISKQREDFHRELFYLGHKPAIKEELTALENLHSASRLHGHPASESEAEEALNRIGLGGFEDVPCRQLSQGQKRRVALARLALTRARLWILDEPFSALDYEACDTLQQQIATHLQRGGITLLTTHQQVALTQGKVVGIHLGREGQGHD